MVVLAVIWAAPCCADKYMLEMCAEKGNGKESLRWRIKKIRIINP